MSVAVKSKVQHPIPTGASAGEWFVARELGTFVVKRMLTLADGSRTAQRAHRRAYASLLDAYTDREREAAAALPGEAPKPPRALEDYVTRLNGRDPKAERLKAQVRFRHSWINDEFLQAYREDILYKSIQDRTNADALFQYLNRYGLNWFLNRKGAFTVQSWKEHEKEWGKYLLNLDEDQKKMKDDLRLFRAKDEDSLLTPQNKQLSAKVLKYTLYEMNRFIRYIYDRRRSEFDDQIIQLVPWGPNFLEGYEANWRVKHQPRPSKYIKPDHWEILAKAMLARNLPWRHQVHLAKDYGLRRRETMGLETSSVVPNYLHLLQQLKKCERRDGEQVRVFKALKGKEKERKIPHWFSDPKITRARIKAMLAAELPHFDTISAGFQKLCAQLKDSQGRALPDYIFHDLRRTFITNAVKKGIEVEDLRQATGHKDPQVLIKFYLMDARELEADFDLGEDDDDYVV